MNSAADKLAKSRQQMEILQRLSKGQPRKEISAEMEISRGTLDTYICRLYARLGVNRPAAALAKFIELHHPELSLFPASRSRSRR